jgi:hydroxymethylpyrimidine/phosphomethylpyrimidine kinase
MNPSQIGNAAARPLIVAIGGVDPGGGAGLGRDLLTAHALGAAIRMVGTAWTEQTAGSGVLSIEPRAPQALADAVRWALREPRPGAIKIGMVPGIEAAQAILRALEGGGDVGEEAGAGAFMGPVVVDPVLYASGGGALWADPPSALLPLLRRAALVTPNAVEATALSGVSVETLADAAVAARAMRGAGIAAVLIKGGHLADGGDAVTDLLATVGGEQRFSRRRLPGPSPRGTGCALATAIAVELASNRSLNQAVERAGDWLGGRIAAAVDVAGERHLG